jgi:hypothetical protein
MTAGPLSLRYRESYFISPHFEPAPLQSGHAKCMFECKACGSVTKIVEKIRTRTPYPVRQLAPLSGKFEPRLRIKRGRSLFRSLITLGCFWRHNSARVI